MNTYKIQPDGIPLIEKAPGALLDYPTDWSAEPPLGPWLELGETIVSHQVTADTGITVNAVVATTTTVTPWISGGTLGQTYTVTVSVTTSLGRTDERSFRIKVVRR